jgi:hypothetical protein
VGVRSQFIKMDPGEPELLFGAVDKVVEIDHSSRLTMS